MRYITIDGINANSLFQREIGQISSSFWCGDHIDQLAQLCLKRGFMKQIDKIAVIWLALEVESEEVENGSFEHEGVVDRYHADFGQAVPAWLRTAGDG